ncbi:hypothetical protein GDO78_022870, partial [Eleutherodactylus coqui]
MENEPEREDRFVKVHGSMDWDTDRKPPEGFHDVTSLDHTTSKSSVVSCNLAQSVRNVKKESLLHKASGNSFNSQLPDTQHNTAYIKEESQEESNPHMHTSNILTKNVSTSSDMDVLSTEGGDRIGSHIGTPTDQTQEQYTSPQMVRDHLPEKANASEEYTKPYHIKEESNSCDEDSLTDTDPYSPIHGANAKNTPSQANEESA